MQSICLPLGNKFQLLDKLDSAKIRVREMYQEDVIDDCVASDGDYVIYSLGEIKDKAKHFGVNPQNGEWEFMGHDYIHPDYE